LCGGRCGNCSAPLAGITRYQQIIALWAARRTAACRQRSTSTGSGSVRTIPPDRRLS